MIYQDFRLCGAHAGMIHRCRLLECRYPAVAPGANSVSGILAARQISFRRPPAWRFQPVRSGEADAIPRRPLRTCQAKRDSGQCQCDFRQPAAQVALPFQFRFSDFCHCNLERDDPMAREDRDLLPVVRLDDLAPGCQCAIRSQPTSDWRPVLNICVYNNDTFIVYSRLHNCR